MTSIATLPVDYTKLYNVKICSAKYKVQKCTIQYRVWRVYIVHNMRYDIQKFPAIKYNTC